MSTDVVMPQMGESIAEGTITRWLKKVGERVERDEPLFEISTDKVDAEIPSPAAGTLSKVLFNEGDTVEVNKVVAVIGEGVDWGYARACDYCGTALDPADESCRICGGDEADDTHIEPEVAGHPTEAREPYMSKQQTANEQPSNGGQPSGNGHGVVSPDGLPVKMRGLVRELNSLMDEYNRTCDRIKSQRDDALKAAQKKFDSAKASLETERAHNDSKLKADEGEADKVKNQIDSTRSSGSRHLEQQSVAADPYFGHDALAGGEAGRELLEEAKRRSGGASRHLSALTKTEKPKNLGGMVMGFAVVGFVVSICAAAGAARGNGGSTFLLVNILASGLGGGIAIARVAMASSAMRNEYGRLLVEANTGYAYLEGFREHVKKEHEKADSDVKRRLGQAQKNHKQAATAAESTFNSEMSQLNRRTDVTTRDARAACGAFYEETGFAGLGWGEAGWGGWNAADSLLLSARVGSLASPQFDFSVPAMLSFSDERGGRCLLLKATGKPKECANLAVQSLLLRLLANVPPGKVLFTLIDPVGLGQNVAPFMPLADFEEKLITSRAWTEPRHIEEQLSKLTEHMENVIQKYLRNDYATIEDYNRSAGEVAEPYRVLVVLDFPVNFSDSAARRLVSIARNGPRCGVYTVIVRDTAKEKPHGFNFEDLEQSAHVIECGGSFVWKDGDVERYALTLDALPADELSRAIIRTVGEKSKDAMRVEVPFGRLLEMASVTQESRWRGSTRDVLQVPLGPSGAKKLQYLTFGKGTEHHAVVIGMPGSGKSNLMHIIVTSMALMYPPDEVQLYLIDFKQGVEFKRYAEAALPHARVVAIESEREFGLSVLKGLDEELYRRGETFRKSGVNALADYRRNFPEEKMPRVLLLVDEFQEFFSYDDQIGREAGLLLDRLVRQGRYAGIHVMLGSQSLANRSSLPSSTLGQVGVRIALKCSESDARQIMADDNPQARLLSRPGEAIYNGASGLIEGNNFFQVALFTEEDRQARLEEIGALASAAAQDGGAPYGRPIVFEGNEPSRLEACEPLKALLASPAYADASKGRDLWLGEPVAIRPPTSARLRRQGAHNLLVVTRNEEEGVGMLASSILSIAAQSHPDDAQFFIADLSTADTAWSELAEELAELLPHRVEVLGRRDMPGALKELVALVNRRIEGEAGGDVYFVIQGLHRARDLREEEPRGRSIFDRESKEPSAPELFARLLREGPESGVHVLAWCDAYSNVKRTLGRGLNEFSLRAAGAMSNDDSMGLIDDSAAAKLDRPHRVIFFDDERPGRLEKFRPYAIPERGWLEEAARSMHGRAAAPKS